MGSRGLSLIVLAFALVGSASADDQIAKSGKQKRADELFEEGRKLLSEGDQNAGAACAKFDEAIKLDPEAPGTMLNLGLCNEKLDKYKTALYWFRKAQARAAETNLPDYENAAKQHTVDLAGKVATIKIAFSNTPPEGTRVKVDGQEVAPADYLSAEVDPGEHTLVAGAPGYKIYSHDFKVEGRGGDTITVDMVAGDNSVVVDRGAGRRTAAIVTASGGVALMITSGIVSYLAKGQYKKCAENGNLYTKEADLVNNKCPWTYDEIYNQTGTANKYAEAQDFANKYQKRALYWGTGFFIAGAAAVGVGAILYFTAPDKERVDRTVFVPTLGGDQIGFAISGSL